MAVLRRTEKDAALIIHKMNVMANKRSFKQCWYLISHLLRNLVLAFLVLVSSSLVMTPKTQEFSYLQILFVPCMMHVAALYRKQMVETKLSIRKNFPRNITSFLFIPKILLYASLARNGLCCTATHNCGRIQKAKIL